jgi:lipopolysaccharide transport system ATP-binding protein
MTSRRPQPRSRTSFLVGRAKATLRPPLRRFRMVTRRSRILPSFLIIGAQRAGTTSLFHYLARHPDIAEPHGLEASVAWTKELHFFDEKFDKGADWYRSFFPLEIWRRTARALGRDLIAGEATPYYLFHPLVPGRVAATLPDVRLVALLRDPVDRAYSHYQMMLRTGREHLSFEDALAAEDERLVGERDRLLSGEHRSPHHRHRAYQARGFYAEQLERWFEHFPRDQLLVLRTEDLLARPAAGYARVLAFLGARPWQPKDFAAKNTASYTPLSANLRARLEERFAEPNARLAHLLGTDFGWSSSATRHHPSAQLESMP